jgi:threonine synthase
MLTPQTQAKKLAKALHLDVPLYLKREDLHPQGSHKGRSIPLMIARYIGKGHDAFCISSSGNAAISAATTINEYNTKHKNKLKLNIFVGKNIDSSKLKIIKKLLNKEVALKKTDNPKQTAFKMDKDGSAKNLRQSTDDTALLGYTSLAKELAKIKNLNAVFIPTSSGTTAQALHEEFENLKLNPQIHIIQTPACHPMVKSAIPMNHSIATAIVDNVGFRKEVVKKAVLDSGGNGWVATNKDISEAITLIKKTENITASPNSALSVVGLELAIKNKWGFKGPIVCLLTGK